MRRASNRLWILILALGLVAGGMASLSTHARADYFPGETTPPPNPEGTGDPDMPDGKSNLHRPAPSRGTMGPALGDVVAPRLTRSAQWTWSLRMALWSVLRVFVRS